MGSPWIKWWLPVLCAIVVIQMHGRLGSVNGCIPEEKKALLNFKQFLKFNNDSIEPLLPSWVHDPNSDCCRWERVTCNSSLGHVIHLLLDNIYQSASEWSLSGTYISLNLSLFQPFKQLRRLNLSSNYFDGLYLAEDYRRMSTLKMLETLDLSNNLFESSIIRPLKALTSLKNLILNRGSIEGPFPAQGLCNMKNLQGLDLSYNNFNGTLDTCLGNLTSLQLLDLSNNDFSGSIPSPLIARLQSLEYLSLSNNKFEGLFSLSLLANHSKLKALRLGDMDSHEFQVETENPPNWVPSFQLILLEIPNSQLNLPTRTMPSFLLYQHSLEFIDLSGNSLVGVFPNWLVLNNPKLKCLLLNNNSFTGSLQLPTDLNSHMDQLRLFDISNNKIQGWIPKNIGFFFPHLEFLHISSNMFNGKIPASIGKLKNLSFLDLTNNNFSGELPKQILLGCICLQVLRLSNNRLQGQILPTVPNWRDLKTLMMDNNQFNGTLEDVLWSMKGLVELDFSNNKLSGRLPENWTGSVYLSYLSVSRNNFEGKIPKALCNVDFIYSIDLSHNRFSGAIPSCFNLQFLEFIHLQGNSLTGTIPKALSKCPKLGTIDLRDNKLTGSISKGIFGLKKLMFLLLGGNGLQGKLSHHICKLKGLNFLDLSRNKFIGSIPSCINNISFARNVDISDHSFYGILSISYPTYLVGYDEYYTRYGDFGSFEEEVQFTTKSVALSYKGDILNYMSGLDLSCNLLYGQIPSQLGDLSSLHALNLSHNHLNGAIPESFHKLQNIESLDISYNNLSGNVPVQLEDLHSLAIFNVSYNNLSGRVPDQGQFGTFDISSYRGNPYLSWNRSNRGNATPPSPTTSSNDRGKNEPAIDLTSLYWSSASTFLTHSVVWFFLPLLEYVVVLHAVSVELYM
ncbi:hypothetical protein L6164_028512 [Bauhinia variegata]|uniref:Uncharacterized protein n=1 Tax=Bauhinia variegata TaxID=167791 RepID=A0ACB9L5W5_BAUVA|nr:hypothetical protein L6164_028512 [Bauhinia variegata]